MAWKAVVHCGLKLRGKHLLYSGEAELVTQLLARTVNGEIGVSGPRWRGCGLNKKVHRFASEDQDALVQPYQSIESFNHQMRVKFPFHTPHLAANSNDIYRFRIIQHS